MKKGLDTEILGAVVEGRAGDGTRFHKLSDIAIVEAQASTARKAGQNPRIFRKKQGTQQEVEGQTSQVEISEGSVQENSAAGVAGEQLSSSLIKDALEPLSYEQGSTASSFSPIMLAQAQGGAAVGGAGGTAAGTAAGAAAAGTAVTAATVAAAVAAVAAVAVVADSSDDATDPDTNPLEINVLRGEATIDADTSETADTLSGGAGLASGFVEAFDQVGSYFGLSAGSGLTRFSGFLDADASDFTSVRINLGVEASGEVNIAGTGNIGNVYVDLDVAAVSGNAYIYSPGDVGNVSVELAGSADGYFQIYAYDDIGDIEINLGSRASGQFSAWAETGSIGNVSLGLEGYYASGYMDLYGEGVGNVSLYNNSYNGVASAFVDVSAGGSIGEISVHNGLDASGAGTAISAFVSGGGSIGDISVDVSGSYASADVWVEASGGGTIGNIDINLTGQSASAYVGASASGGIIGDVTLTLTGTNTSGGVYLYAQDGDIGDLTISALGNSASAYISANVSGGSIGDVVINAGASGDASAGLYASGGGSIGDITLNVNGPGGEIDAHVDASGGSIGDIVLNARYSYASANISAYASGGTIGDITLTADGAYEAGAFVSANASGGTIGNILATATGVYSDVYVGAYANSGGSIGTITLNVDGTYGAGDVYAQAEVIGNVVVNATGYSGNASAYIDIVTSVGTINIDVDGVYASAYVEVSGGTSVGEVTITGSDVSGYAEFIYSGDVAITVDATGFAGSAYISTGSGADDITGGDGRDYIFGNAGVDTLTGGDGSDTFWADVSGGDFITDFVAADDFLSLSGAYVDVAKAYEEVATVAGNITGASNVIVFGGTTSLAAAAAAIAADADVNGVGDGYIIFSDGTDTFVYGSDDLGDNGTELLLFTLEGVTDPLTLTASNIIA